MPVVHRFSNQPFGRRLALIAGGALAVRLVYIFVIAPEPVGVGGDASFYHSAANLIAQGHFYERRIFGHAYQTALHPPLYSLVLSVVAWLGGVHLLPQRLVGLVIGTASVYLFGALGRRIGGAERTGLIAAAIAAIYPPFITADGSIMSEPLYVLLLVVALLLALALIARPTVARAAALGAVLGLSVLTRTDGIFLIPLLAWPAAWGGPGRRDRATRLLAATAAAAIVIAPWMIRNEVEFHKLELAANYDTVIPAANCPDTYYGNDIGWWSLNCLARARTHHQLLIGDASPSRGFTYVGEHPARAVLVAAVRVLRTFSFWQPLRIGNHEPRRKWFDALGLAFYYPLLIAAAAGLWRLPRSRWLLLAPVYTTLILVVFGWGNSRFRIGADVSIVVLAAYLLSRLHQ
ncbi:MAG TPA: glycosyltransferase family 39 protein, partial [Solirubrobacteraceae bacterium]|nr:glycosyltransferase family 39 protein [Solirubrobacteraceae bacterium]